jgi:hypothetical protein
MREPTKRSPEDRGEVSMAGTCQVCGATGDTIALPGRPPPNQVCRKCAIDYPDVLASDEDDAGAI